jgi:ORF6N domain
VSPAARKKNELVPVANIEAEAASRILTVRGQRVVLDSDLADFYGVETRVLAQQVSRNLARFPKDFAFRLTRRELDNLKSQNVIASRQHGGRRTLPLVFTEQGALAVSGVLKSERAAEVSVAVARAFVAMRDQLAELDSHPVLVEVAKRLAKLEKHTDQQTDFNQLVLDALRNADSFIELVEGQITEAP